MKTLGWKLKRKGEESRRRSEELNEEETESNAIGIFCFL